ncbi:MAG: 16S rRNA (uracil(1498)-N(3))-methyltransferase [Clostridia bacterium]|nr:16S rRNA (uracil(1498)-N(3))-methyltransferase [Clostridia bacterium]
MPRFFISSEQIEINDGVKVIHILGDDAHHIARALRMAQGEKIEAVDSQKTVYNCTLSKFIEDKEIIAIVESESVSDTEPKYEVILYQALPKSDKMETIIQKAVECGATKIVPFKSERCIVKIDKKDENKKLDRWQKISESASKQCGRGIIPKIESILTFEQMIEDAKKCDLPLFCYEAEDGKTIKDALKCFNGSKIAIIVGSEGGFSINEAERITNSGIRSVGLGKRILRCETASSFALACIVYENEL